MANTDISANQGRLVPMIVVAVVAVALGMATLACQPKDDAQVDSQTGLLAELPAEQPDQPTDATTDQPAEARPVSPAAVIGTKLGQQAPPFNLPQLVYEQADDGELTPSLSAETTDLASFRGRQVVCVFFSSYT